MPFIVPAIAAAVEAVAVIGSFITSIGVIGQGIIAAGIGIASTYLISALTPKPASENVQGGVNFERQYGSNVPRQVACGLVGMAGHDTYVNTYNASNRTLQQIFTLSDYLSTRLTRVAVDGVWVTLGTDIHDGKGFPLLPTTAAQQWAGSLWVKFFDGRQVAADGTLVTFANPASRWTAANIGVGITAVSVICEFDKDHNNSMPDFFFEFEGAPIYDWRKDSTNGGSGSHRWNDITTHEYTTNPILIERHYRRGFSINGDTFCGMDMQESDLPINKWTTAANICAEIDPDDGKPRYQVSILLDATQPHSSNLQSLSLSCGSMQVDSVDGSWPLVGSDQPVVMTFTDDDLISTADSEFIRFKSFGELVNSVSGNYPEPGAIWSMVGYTEQVATAFLTIDRRTRDLSIDFPMVSVARQAQQLAFIYLYENRFEAVANVTLRPRFQVLEEGDWVNWNSAQYGLFTFIVKAKSLLSLEADGPRNTVLQLQQRDGGIYDGIIPVPTLFATRNNDPVYLAEVQSFALVAITVQGNNGRLLPAIRVSWLPTIPDDVTVVQIELIYYPSAQPTAVLRKIVNADVSVVNLTEGIVSNTNYTVQAKIITNPSRVTAFNAGGNVTTSNVQVGFVDIDQTINYNITTLQDLFADDITKIKRVIASIVANQDARNWLDKKELRTQLSSRSNAAFAEITHVQSVLTNADNAMASDILDLFVGTDSGSGTINVTANALSTLTGNFTTFSATITASFNSLDDQINHPGTGLTAQVSTNASAITGLTGALASYETIVSASATYATLTGLATTNSNVTTNATAIATLDGYAAARYSVTIDVNGYAVGFDFFNGGAGVSATIFTTAKFEIAAPGVSGGAAIPIFTVGMVNGVSKVGIRGDMYVDGDIISRMVAANQILATHIAATQINASHMAANSITAANAALDALAVKTLNIQGNAVTIPDANTIANFLGTGSGAAIFNYNVSVDTTGLSGNFKLYVACMANKMSFTAVGVSWSASLFINGTQVMDVGGTNNDYPLLLTGALAITATGGVQTINVTVNWNCSNSGTIVKSTCFSIAARR